MSLRVTLDRGIAAAEMAFFAGREKLQTGLVWNPTLPDYRADPYPHYRALRERDPIHRSFAAGGWVLSRHRDVVAVLRDPGFSSDERNWSRYRRLRARGLRAGLPDPYETERASMLRVDPPDHSRLRNLVSKAFTPRAVEQMRPRIESILKELLDPLGTSGTFELVRDIASPLPVTVIAEMLGVPTEDRERFRHWSDDVIRTLGDSTLEDRRAAVRAMEELGGYLVEIAEQRRREPRNDLLSSLVAAEEAGDKLSPGELATMGVLLLVAGNETTTNLIANGTLALLSHPDQWALLQREPERIPNAVEELLRFDSPVQLTSRLVKEDGELEGRPLRRGEQLVLLLGAANRDPEAFPEPDRLDVTRENVRHLSFGHGIHFCLGAQLARLETTLAFQALLERFPRLALVGDGVTWRPNTVLRGPQALPLRY